MKTSPIQINEHLSIVGSLLPGMASYLRQILSPGTGGYRVWLSSVAGGSPSYALTFGMETREDIVQFRRRKSVSGTIGRSAVTRPPPRKTVWILVGGQSVRARPVHSGSLSCPEQGGGYEEGPTGSTACGEGASPLLCPHPRGDIHHGPLSRESPGILHIPQPRLGGWGRSPEPVQGFDRVWQFGIGVLAA